MSEIDRLKSILEGISGNPADNAQLRWVTCSQVDDGTKTMTAARTVDDLPLYDIMLGIGAVTIYPAPGAVCLVGIIEGRQAQAFLIAAAEIDRIEVNAGKIAVGNDSVQLIELFSQLVELLKTKFKVYTPAGPSGTALPDTILELNDFENNFKNLLSDVK